MNELIYSKAIPEKYLNKYRRIYSVFKYYDVVVMTLEFVLVYWNNSGRQPLT